MKINKIIDNYVNGNIDIFKVELNKLNKIEWTLLGKAHTEVMQVVHRYLI